LRKSDLACQRTQKASDRNAARSIGREPGHRSHVYRESAPRRRPAEPVQHASATRRSHCAVGEYGLRTADQPVVESSYIPLLFKEGWLHLNKKIPFLSGADGMVSKFPTEQGALRGYIRWLPDLFLAFNSCFALSGSRFAPALGYSSSNWKAAH